MSERGSASVEHAALVLLAAAVAIVAVSAARAVSEPGRTPPLVSELLRKQRCAVRYPGPCWEDPLKEAYGRAVAGAVRALAPAPLARAGPGGEPLVGVDYRRCRQPGCAVPLPGPEGAHLTVSNRRTAAFTAVRGDREGAETIEIEYWIYRPALGWELVRRRLAWEQVEALARTPLPDDADPKLIPLETLLGRDEARFPPAEEPPWRGKVESRWGG
jgi:hypothetical protein